MDAEELKRRRQEREALRKKRLARQRKLAAGLIAGCVVLILCTVLIIGVARKQQPAAAQTTPPQTAMTTTEGTTAEEPQALEADNTVIRIAAVGDLNVTDQTVDAGVTDTGFDYTRVFMDVVPLLSEADLTVLNFEGNLAGAPYGAAGEGSAPQQMIQAVANAGVDMVQMANSCSINHGISGLGQTLQEIRLTGMEPLGAYADEEEFRKSGGYVIRQVQGVRVAFVAFTKGMGNLGLPGGSENCVNTLYTDYDSTYQNVDKEGITRILRKLQEEEVPDVTIALLHWGSEYNDQISDSQKQIRDLMYEEGVDAIIGTHSHYVQEMSLDKEKNRFLAYSLGDFFSDGERAGSDYSVVLELEITRNNLTGDTTITDYSYTPIYTRTGENGLQVVRLDAAMAAFEADNIQKVSQEEYDAMANARQRIEERIHPEG